MIVGIPNVGKSTLINALVGKRVTAVGDKPGVTKVQQWIRINQDLELLDTPGVLWPKFDDQVIGLHLAITGGINDNILPIIDVATYFIDFLNKYYPNALTNRYQLDFTNLNAMEQLELIAKNRITIYPIRNMI
ncbi:MAG: GTPase [Bacilli bacterium]